jgi:hypothetical protein
MISGERLVRPEARWLAAVELLPDLQRAPQSAAEVGVSRLSVPRRVYPCEHGWLTDQAWRDQRNHPIRWSLVRQQLRAQAVVAGSVVIKQILACSSSTLMSHNYPGAATTLPAPRSFTTENSGGCDKPCAWL